MPACVCARAAACTLSNGPSHNYIWSLLGSKSKHSTQKWTTSDDPRAEAIDRYLGKGVLRALDGDKIKTSAISDVCDTLMKKLVTKETVCGQPYGYDARKIDCTAATSKPEHRDLLAVLSVCVTPCMNDNTRTCCAVPESISHRFPCCRELRCCPDQTRRRVQATSGPREAQVSVSVSVSVAVEETSSSVSVYDALLRCLQNPAKLDAMCLTGSSGH